MTGPRGQTDHMFIPATPAAAPPGTVFVLYIDSVNRPSVAGKIKVLLAPLPEDVARNFSIGGAGVVWGTPAVAGTLPRRCGLQFWDGIASYIAEIYDGPLSNGYIRAVARRHKYAHVLSEAVAAPVVPAGANFGPTPSATPWTQLLEETSVSVTTPLLISTTSYLADPSVDTWLTVAGGSPVWGDWVGPVTPAGKYDLRFTGGLGGCTVSCLRWVNNPLYNAANPYSPPFVVYSYNFSINVASAPAGVPYSPHAIGPDATYGPPALAQQTQGQDMSYTAAGLRYYEAGDDTGWALSKQALLRAKFRYDYSGTVTTSPVGTYPATGTHAAYTYQIEAAEITYTTGLRVLRNGVVEYDDMPTGITTVSRVEVPGTFPSYGTFQVTGPAATGTMRGAGRWSGLYSAGGGLELLLNYNDPPAGYGAAAEGGDNGAASLVGVSPRPSLGFVALVQVGATVYLVDNLGMNTPIPFLNTVGNPDIFEGGGFVWVASGTSFGSPAGNTFQLFGGNWAKLNAGGVVTDYTAAILPVNVADGPRIADVETLTADGRLAISFVAEGKSALLIPGAPVGKDARSAAMAEVDVYPGLADDLGFGGVYPFIRWAVS